MGPPFVYALVTAGLVGKLASAAPCPPFPGRGWSLSPTTGCDPRAVSPLLFFGDSYGKFVPLIIFGHSLLYLDIAERRPGNFPQRLFVPPVNQCALGQDPRGRVTQDRDFPPLASAVPPPG